jgi:hypothetical protein
MAKIAALLDKNCPLAGNTILTSIFGHLELTASKRFCSRKAPFMPQQVLAEHARR